MNMVMEYLLRLCVGGICCAAAITLSGTGTKREITRFACTCVMLLLCFSGIKEIDFADMDILEKPNLQDTVDDALEDQQVLQQGEVDSALEQYIQEQALTMGCNCWVTVRSQLEDGEYQIELIMIGTAGAVAHAELQGWIVTTFKIKETQIRWEEAP